MRLLVAAGLASACLATSPLFAADLFGTAPPPMDAPVTETELGTNWYIRGDVGWGQTNQATIVPQDGLFPTIYQGGFFNALGQFVPTYDFNGAPAGNATSPVAVVRGNNQSTTSMDYGLGFGYRVNDWFRIEADYNFSKGPGLGTQAKVYCPEATSVASNYTYASATDTGGTANPVGDEYDWTTCNGYLNAHQYNNTGLVMGYVDLGHWGLFTPFIGAGAGLNVNTIQGSMNYYQNDTGAVYSGVQGGGPPYQWVAPTGQTDQAGKPVYAPLVNAAGQGPSMVIGPQNWYRSFNSTKYTFAASGAAGVGFQISQSATLDLAYHFTSLDISQGFKEMRQSVTLGVRYNIN